MNRPQTGRHAPAAVRAAAAAADKRRSGNTWFSRIVDPASRLITPGAVKWLSAVFKENHPALPSAGDVVEEIEEDSLQEVPEEAVENAKVLGQDEEDTPVSKQRSEPEFTEVEQLLKNKTFSREEFNRLTELLQSRIVDRSAGLKVCEEQSREELHGGAGPSNAVNAEAQRWCEERQKAREEKNDSGSEPLAATFKGSSTSGLSESSPAFSSSSSMFSTSTTVATTSAGLPLFGGSVSKVNGMNSVPFSFAGKSSSAATTAKVESKLRSPDTVTQVEASSVVAEDQSIKSSTSGENCTIKSQNEPKSSGFASSPSLVGVTNGTLSTLSSTTAISASTSSRLPNTQSSFAGSLFGQVPSSATATTSGSFVFGSSADSSSLSSGNTSPSLFGSTLSASASGASGSLFGLTAPSSLSSSSLPSFGLSNSSTSAQFASSSTPAPGLGTAPTFGAGSSLSVGSAGTSNFSGSSSTSFGLGSTSQFGSNTSPSFGLSTTPQFGSNASPSFGLSTTPQFGSSTSPSFGLTSLQSSSSTAPSFVPGVTFGSNTSSFTIGSTPSFGSGSTPVFGSGSTPPFGSGSTPSFGSGSTFGSSSSPSFGGSSSSFVFVSASAPSFGGSSVSFGAASTPAFGGGSASYGSASTPLFGSNSTPSFGLGQPFGASSTTSSQSTMTSFGSGFGGTASLPSTGFSFGGSAAASSGSFTFGGAGSTPSGTTFSFGSGFGGTASLPSTGFSFGGSAAASSGSFTFGGAGSTPSGTTFLFGSTGTPPSTFTFAWKDSSSMTQPIFGLTNSNSAFGAAPSPTPPADQMEDSMEEDPAQVSSPVPPVFGGQTASPAPSFVFGSQPTAPSAGQSVFQFGAQPGPAAANPFASSAPSTFNPAGGSGLVFSGGGFSLGAEGDRGNRKFIKAKRDKTRRK